MNTGKIIPIAYPDTFVRYSERGFQKNILSSLGLGNDGYIKAGHALLILINNSTGALEYFDFGRYITPKGMGRVRSILTDAELYIPLKAVFDENDHVKNIAEILVWLEAHPEKTHGEGRLVASVCNYVNYDKASAYLKNLQQLGSMPYKTFGTKGSNCSRLVTDTLIASTTKKAIKTSLKRINYFTPSPLGNVKYAADKGDVFQVYNGEFSIYKDSVFKENMTNYFTKRTDASTSIPILKNRIGQKQLLDGVGASAYFELIERDGNIHITRYTANLEKDFEGVFESDNTEFRSNENFEFIHDSNCHYCHIKQHEKVFKFTLKKKIFPHY